jgi:hypothetical protein
VLNTLVLSAVQWLAVWLGPVFAVEHWAAAAAAVESAAVAAAVESAAAVRGGSVRVRVAFRLGLGFRLGLWSPFLLGFP